VFDVEMIVRCPRHTVSFSEGELVEILKSHMRAQGANVPEGSAYVWGLEDPPHYGSRPKTLTLAIDPD
jgi:hypothetical protein